MAKKAKKVVAKKAKTAPKKKAKPASSKGGKVAAKKLKATVKKKLKKLPTKKVKISPKNKAKSIAVKAVKSSVKTKKAVKKLAKAPTKTKAKISVKLTRHTGGKAAKPARPVGGKVATKKIKKTALNIAIPEIKIHGEDLHFIPEHEQKQPITTFEVHAAENVFHHKDEVAFRQENKKVQQSIVSQKNAKRFGRRSGRR